MVFKAKYRSLWGLSRRVINTMTRGKIDGISCGIGVIPS
jgi:phage head maturation protease